MFMSVTWVSCIRFWYRFAWALGESLVYNEASLLFHGAGLSRSESAVTGKENFRSSRMRVLLEVVSTIVFRSKSNESFTKISAVFLDL